MERLSLSDPVGRRVLLVTVLGSAMGFLDATIVNVAGLQWTLNGSARYRWPGTVTHAQRKARWGHGRCPERAVRDVE
jgi:hypothetical protein